MTIENQIYGVPHWLKCSNCDVTQPPSFIVDGKCKDTKKCAEWKASLAAATPADIQQAAKQLCDAVTPTADQLLAEMAGSSSPRKVAK